MKQISLIAAVSENWGIGKNGKLLVKVPGDLPRFKRLTTGHTIIMGRKTLDSFGGRLLPNRRHIVLTRDMDYFREGVEVVHSVEEALALCKEGEESFCIGGGEIYDLFLPYANKMYLTEVEKQFLDADTFFPMFLPVSWVKINKTNYEAPEGCGFNFAFVDYERK